MHKAERLVPESGAFEVKLKRHK